MTSATSVLLAFLSSREEAGPALSALQSSLERAGVDVIGAATITLKPDARIRVDKQPIDLAKLDEDDDVMGQLFPLRICALPAIGRQADSAASHYAALGVEKNLLKELGENLAPSSAAIVAVISESWVAHAGTALGGVEVERYPFAAHIEQRDEA